MSTTRATPNKLKQDNWRLFSVLIIVTLLLNFPIGGNCLKRELQTAVDEEKDVNSCPPWYVQHKDNCYCCLHHDPKGIVYENSSKCLSENDLPASVLLQIGFCMTFDSERNKTLLVNCPYDTVRGHKLHRLYVVINSSVSNLNSFTCSPLNRQEENCRRCIDNYGPSPYTLDLSCFNCTIRYRGWILYFTLEIIPLTVFFTIITVLRIRPSQGYLNSFILFSQLIVSGLSFSSQVPFIYSMEKMPKVSLVLVRILQSLYGFWNLDFFRYAIPGFCVSSKLQNLDVLSLQLISVFYPMSLILTAWIVIHLYERNFKPFVWAWRPFRRCLSHYSVTNNPKRAVVNLFTMFLLLSYSKLLFVAVNLTNTIGVYRFDPFSHHSKPVHHDKSSSLFLDPSMRYFSHEHARYVVLSVFLFVVFILPPPIILLLYPTKWFQTHLNKCCSKSRTIRMFAHSCHGCFKNGLNGTRDCRHFAGAYLLLRITLFLCKTAIINPVAQWIMVAFCFAVATIMIGLYRPYKNPYLSALDFVLMLCFSITALFSAFVTTNNPTKNDISNKLVSVVFGFIFLSTLLPLMYMSCLVFYLCQRKCKKVKHFLISRRRDYLDISDFQYDPEQENSDNIMEQGQAASILRSRVLNSDSFQSE